MIPLTLTKRYFIVVLFQNGNIGAPEIRAIKDQPKEGFINEESAEGHLAELLHSNKYPYNNWAYQYAILKFYGK